MRAGPKPDEGDYIAEHLTQLTSSLYANKRYINKYGMPKTLSDLQHHKLVAGFNARVLYFEWVDKHIPAQQIKLRVSESSEATRAIIKGLGIGGLQHGVAT